MWTSRRLRMRASLPSCARWTTSAPLVAQAARDRAAFRLTHYAQELAALFHSFYTNCHIVGEEPALRDARLALADASRIVLATTLGLLGVSAPAKM